MNSPQFADLLERLGQHAIEIDWSNEWPTNQLEWLKGTSVLKWAIPEQYGGASASEYQMLEGYERLAEACLATTFILTQRNGACQRIAGSENESLKRDLLPRLATGEIFATVGISHLTTSRQHLKTPAVQVELGPDEIRFQGTIPWVTGAAPAQFIVTGGTCADGAQLLAAIPTNVPGITVDAPVQLMSLTASATTAVQLENVRIPREMLIAGPVEQVMARGKGGGAGSLTTSVLALGLCRRVLKILQQQAERRPDVASTCAEFRVELADLRSDLYTAAQPATDSPGSTPTTIRKRANSLALRITQAALAVTKGAGFVQGHPVELAIREAMFFLVWSCPQLVLDNVIDELLCRASG